MIHNRIFKVIGSTLLLVMLCIGQIAAAPNNNTNEAEKYASSKSQHDMAALEAAPAPTWITLFQTDFEEGFPSYPVNAYDGDNPPANGEYFWGDTNYRAAGGQRSMWVAAGGNDGIDPSIASTYPSNLNSWLVIGPFNLSEALAAHMQFHYLNNSEADIDIFGWYASTNGIEFYGTETSGDSIGWQFVDFDLTNVPTLGNVTGYSSVYVAFAFRSDVSVESGGAFVDNILIEAEVPAADISISGRWQFRDKNNNIQNVEYVKWEVYDYDPGEVDDLLCDGYGGAFSCITLNGDEDGSNIDPYVKIYTVSETGLLKIVKVNQPITKPNCSNGEAGDLYSEQNAPLIDYNRASLELDPIVIPQKQENAAWYIFRWIKKSEIDLYLITSSMTNEGWQSDTSLTVLWSPGAGQDGSCYNDEEKRIYLKDEDGWSPHVFLHEHGHFILDELYPQDIDPPNCGPDHTISQASSPGCAWSEGWANFFAGYILNNPKATPNLDLENAKWYSASLYGIDVEGSIAALLWDVSDGEGNEGFDLLSNFELLWSILKNQRPDNVLEFRDAWYTSNFADVYYMNSDKVLHKRCGLPDILASRNITAIGSIAPGYTLNTLVVPTGSGSVYAQIPPNCSSTLYKPGTFVPLTALKSPGYEFDNWSGDVSGNSDLVHVTMNNNKTVTATFRQAPTFTDVLANHWSWSWIERLSNAGITGGCGVGNYCPEASVTRGQMAVFLERGMHGSSYTPPAVGAGTGFSDVPTSYWSAAWIKQLAADGITGGCGIGVYCPDYPVTRAQMAVFLLKAKYGSSYIPPAIGTSTGFNDVAMNYWAAPWIKQLAAEGITGGCGIGIYCPEIPVTRAQMAVFLVRTFNLP